MSWLKTIQNAWQGKPEREGAPPGVAPSPHPPLTDLLDPLPAGSRIKRRRWSKIRELHREADALEQMGLIMEARGRSVEALNLALAEGGNDDPGLGVCFFHFALGVEHSGDLTGAEPNYNGAYSLLKAAEGEPTPLKAEILLHYGTLYMRMRLGWRAVVLLSLARDYFAALYGPEDENVGRVLMGIAMSQEIEFANDAALESYDRALPIITRAWGHADPRVAFARRARADVAFWLAANEGDRPAVERELQEMREDLLQFAEEAGEDHPEVASRRATIGVMLISAGHEEEGAALLGSAVPVLAASGQTVPGFRRQLALSLARLGRPEEALPEFRRAMQEQGPIGERLAHGAEGEREKALLYEYANLELLLEIVLLAEKQNDPALAAEVCDLFLAHKGLGAELLYLQRQAIAGSRDPVMQELMSQLVELRGELAAGSLSGVEQDGSLEWRIKQVEWELASLVPELSLSETTAFTHETAAQLLPPDAALIELVCFTRRLQSPAAAPTTLDATSQWYVAFVIPSGGGEGVRLVDLGPAAEMNRLLYAYLLSHGILDDLPASFAAGDKLAWAASDETGEEGRRLRERLLDPLWPFIAGCRRLFVAPDGALTWLPFEILELDEGAYLVDRLDVSYLSVGRDLRRLNGEQPAAPFSPPIVLADPDYDLPRPWADGAVGEEKSRAGEPPAAADPLQATAAEERHAQLREDLTRSGMIFRPLPGTRDEGIAVAALLGVEPLLGEAASEQRLKTARSPLVLHVATHGFYFPAPAPDDEINVAARGDLKAAAARSPLVRSGLVLSGANSWLREQSPPDLLDDGILHSEDILAVDLLGTELVVLSACRTGLGDLMPGEGVVGLRRAFLVAGAKTLVLSLWSVPDKQTRLLMTYFYEALLDGQGRAAALRQAQRRLRDQFPDPYFWAAFVCVGDPRPISQLPAQGDSGGAGS